MTNAIVLSVVLQTNWAGIVKLSNGQAVQEAQITRYTTAHYMDGTNKIMCGVMLPVEVGSIFKTNHIANSLK